MIPFLHFALSSRHFNLFFLYLSLDTFSRMMWFKTTSVYLALSAGFEVMFQDVDLVWLKGKLLSCVLSM